VFTIELGGGRGGVPYYVTLPAGLITPPLRRAFALSYITMAPILRKQDIHMHCWCLFLLSFALPLSFHS
jgi:hypothetical protein